MSMWIVAEIGDVNKDKKEMSPWSSFADWEHFPVLAIMDDSAYHRWVPRGKPLPCVIGVTVRTSCGRLAGQ